MATVNPFDLLGDDAEDPSLFIAAQQKVEVKKTVTPSAKPGAAGAKQLPSQNKTAPQAKLPSKPLPPTQAVREGKSEFGRGGRGGGRGYGGRGRGGSYRSSNENSYGNREISAGQGEADESEAGKPYERRGGYNGPRGPYRGGRRGGFSNGEGGEAEFDRPRRQFDRRSGTGQGYEVKREGAGRWNWGSQSDEVTEVADGVVNEGDKSLNADKPSGEEDAAADGEKEVAKGETEEKEPEAKEMTLEEYEKVLEEKRKALQALKTADESRKVDAKEFASMQQLSNKKANDEIFIKLGSDKDKKKELAENEERAKKSVSINEFLKPAEGEKYYTPGGRGRGRGRGSRGDYSGGSEMGNARAAPSIEDPGQFPTLGAK